MHYPYAEVVSVVNRYQGPSPTLFVRQTAPVTNLVSLSSKAL